MGKQKKKEHADGGRQDAARRLTRLAGIIADGRTHIMDREIELGDEVESDWSVTVKDGFIHYELALRIPVEGTSGPVDNATAPETGSISPPPASKGKKRASKGRYQAKKTKKTTGALWKIVKKSVSDRVPLSDADIADIQANFKAYDEYVQDEWRDRWQECVSAAERCMDAARQGDFKTAETYLRKVNELTKACHAKYK